MRAFEFTALPWNIIFGAGALARLPEVLDRLGCARALVLATARQREDAARVVAILGRRAAGSFTDVAMHVPVETIARARTEAARLAADCTVSIGGGSTTGLGKALKLEAGLAHVAVPTTYAGSEMTNIWGKTEGGHKLTARDVRVVPAVTIYDPELTLGLPPHIAGPSGINALAQAVVNVCARDDNPIVTLMALEAIRILARSLPAVVRSPRDLAARTEALYGACLAGAALGSGTTGLHHRLCHTLGGSFDTPHAETHTILLPHTVAYNAAAVPEGTRRVAAALGVADAAAGLFALARQVGAKTALRDVGFAAADLDRAAELATAQPCPNPAPVTRAAVRDLLGAAWEGRPPRL